MDKETLNKANMLSHSISEKEKQLKELGSELAPNISTTLMNSFYHLATPTQKEKVFIIIQQVFLDEKQNLEKQLEEL